MTLHVTRSGRGPALALLHGWALNSHVWDDLVPQLAEEFTVVCIDLPGHGASAWSPGFHDLGSLAETLAPEILPGSVLLGWSLGALAALQLAISRPRGVRALITVAGTPKFLRSADWLEGIDPDVLLEFADHLRVDFEPTVREFLALQVRGDDRATQTLRRLRRDLLAHGPPDHRALEAGLEILRGSDLRERLARIQAPALVIAGERDRLTPPGASHALAAALPRAQFHLVSGAAHAPFLSQPQEFLREVRQFLRRVIHGESSPVRA